MNSLYTIEQYKFLLDLVGILKDRELLTILQNNSTDHFVEYDRKLTDLYNDIKDVIEYYENEKRKENRQNTN
jgi:hypothetical protein|tara:strand:- start:3783 stop:3998 length:216 start_codon:yes stop_codon:yes gene_type:complete